tara:strand:+ start:4555 stop:5163 length:609 start_codon:yes stop_codon:yes gene_type:complete
LNQEIKISRSDLINKCEQFLGGKIQKSDLENYAWKLISEDFFDWDDEVISDIIFQWDNQTINFPINETNIRLWKHQLETDENLLEDYNLWNVHIDRQKAICEKYDSKWNPIDKKLKIGIGSDLNADPIHGLRHPKEKGTTGWYIWTGEYSESDDFFQPMCAEHLLQIRPELIKYFGLEVGYRFLIDKNGYEDVWYDEKLKNV